MICYTVAIELVEKANIPSPVLRYLVPISAFITEKCSVNRISVKAERGTYRHYIVVGFTKKKELQSTT